MRKDRIPLGYWIEEESSMLFVISDNDWQRIDRGAMAMSS